jgi:hypothetical protein
VARGFATARTACVRIDLGIQQTLHTTLNSYLEKLLYLVTGNFGKRGGNNLHTFLLPLIGHSDERSQDLPAPPTTGCFRLPASIRPTSCPMRSRMRVRIGFARCSWIARIRC